MICTLKRASRRPGAGVPARRVLGLLVLATLAAGPAFGSSGSSGSSEGPRESRPESELAFHRGVASFGKGDLESARRDFQAVLREEPENRSALHYLALIAIRVGDTASAIDYLQRVVALSTAAGVAPGAPGLVAARMDLGAQLLVAQRNDEALAQFEAVLEQHPGYPTALLYQGIARYRLADYDEAIDSLKQAAEADRQVSAEAHYYIGLSEAHLGDAGAAVAAFSTAASASPQDPLGRSATTLGAQAARVGRPWSLAATVGFEYDDNVRLSPDNTDVVDQPGATGSPAAVARLQGQAEAYRTDQLIWRVGYDGYLQIYTKTHNQDFGTGKASPYDLSQQTHLVWTNASYDFDSLSVALRYDFSYTLIDLDKKFRTIQRVAPTVYVPVSDWGLFLAYYQFLYYDYSVTTSDKNAFNRSGPQHSVGAQQFVFLPAPFRYVVLGGLLTSFHSDGTEFRHNGVEVSAGGEMDLPWGLSAGLLYRYDWRQYTKYSAVTSTLQPPRKRQDNEQQISFNLDRTFARQYTVSLAGSYAYNASNIDNFDIQRFIIGAYVRYAF